MTRARNHAQAVALAQPRVGNAYDGRVQDLRVRVEDLLDLPREELLAAAVDHLLEPPDDLHVAGPVELTEIARAEPAVGSKELGVRRRVLVVAEMDRRSKRGDLALSAIGNVASRVVDQSEAEAGGDDADRPGHRLGIVLEPRVGVKSR